MDTKLLLIKIITIIYRTRQIKNLENDDLIRTILNTIKIDTNEFNFNGTNYIRILKEYIVKLLEETEPISKEVILQHLKVILEHDSKLYDILKESIVTDHDEASIKRIITSYIKQLNNYYKEYLALEIINKASYDLKFNRSKIQNFSDYLKEIIGNLEPLTNTLTSLKDPALVNEIDFENLNSIETIFTEVKNINTNKSVYKLGWQAINRMLQGGVRLGETVFINALQHKYKTGFTLSMFMQIALHNKPIITNENKDKKPLLLRISFEDSLTNNLQFMFQYLKACDGEFISPRDFDNINSREMTEYITNKLTANGFHIKILRIDPSQWSYSSVLNKIIELEAQGYCIHVLMLDYLMLLPTVGCISGPLGSDKKDLLLKIRNFCSARNITFITPNQLSSEAKQLLRNGVDGIEFLKAISGKGYTDGVKSIDQHIDLNINIHLYTINKVKYLSVGLDKHRLPTVIDEDDRYATYKFPGNNIPILEDINGEDTSIKRINKNNLGNSIVSEIIN